MRPKEVLAGLLYYTLLIAVALVELAILAAVLKLAFMILTGAWP